MTEKKTIEFKGYYFRLIFITFVLSYLIVFASQHFGTFGYSYYRTEKIGEPVPGLEGADYVYYSYDRGDLVKSVNFKTILGSNIIFPPDGWRIRDLDSPWSNFYNYNNKFKYYNEATIKEIGYVLFIWVLLVLIILFTKKFKIKIT